MKNVHHLSAWFYQKTSLGLVLLFLGLQVLSVAVVLPKFEKALAGHAALKILDLRFGFSPAEAHELLEALGEPGRAQYRLLETTLDLVYPLVYTGLFVLLLSLLYRQAIAVGSSLRAVNLLPFLVLLMDYLENAGIVRMINRFPEQSDALARWVSGLNQAKWIVFFVVVGIAVFGLGRAALAFLRKRKKG